MMEFDDKQREYIRTKIIPSLRQQGGRTRFATDQEIEDFLLVANAYGLDPIRKQILAQWRGGALIAAPTIDGLRYKAAETRDLDGTDAPVWGPEVEREYQVDKWEGPDGARRKVAKTVKVTIPEWCQVTVYRRGAEHGFTGVYYWDEYVRGKPTDTQLEMPRLMLGKAAESQALRRAFPEALGGLITFEEMGTDGTSEPHDVPWDRDERGDDARSNRKPDPPRITAAAAAEAARKAAQQHAAANRPAAGQQAAAGASAANTSAQQAIGEQQPANAGAKQTPSGDEKPDDARKAPIEDQRVAGAKRLPPDAKWYLLPDVAEDQLSVPAEAVVIENRGWEKGTVVVDVASVASGQKATLTFKGPAAGRLAAVKKDQRIWVRLGADRVVAAYHVPGDKLSPAKAAG